MTTQFSRSELVLGKDSTAVLTRSRVAVFGLGGVGSYAVEALARAGIGSFLLVDSDSVSLTNLNRQLFATHSSVGRPKTEVAAERIRDINPEARVETFAGVFGRETAEAFDFSSLDFVLDCIDTVSAKLLLIERCKVAGTPILCSMGTGNKRDATRFEFADVSETSVCPLARVMRHEVKRRGLGPLRVLYSREEPSRVGESEEVQTGAIRKRVIPGSLPFVPPVAGLLLAGEAVKALLEGENAPPH